MWLSGARVWLLGVSARVAVALELGIGSGGHEHPLFKALEPWEAWQGEAWLARSQRRRWQSCPRRIRLGGRETVHLTGGARLSVEGRREEMRGATGN